MNSLIVLVEFLNKNRIKHIDALGTDTMLQEFYDGLISGKLIDNNVAMNHFFPKADKYQLPYFNRLKRRLKERLLNLLFLVDFNQAQYTSQQTAYYTCYRNLAAIKTMIGRFLRKPAIELAEQTIKIAQEYEFADIVFHLARELRSHYSSIENNKKKYTYYDQLVEDHLKLQIAEVKAENYHAEISSYFNQNRALPIGILDKVIAYAEELKTYTFSYSSYRLNLLSFLIFALRYEIENDAINTIRVCKEALTFFENKNQTSLSVKFNFLNKMISSQIKIKQYDEAESIINKNILNFDPGTINYYYVIEYYLILCFYTKNYQKGYGIYTKLISDPLSDRYPLHIKEHVQVFGAIFQYLYLFGAVEIPLETAKNYRVSKFLNAMPTYERDKRGINITILILQILFLLHQKKYSSIIDRVEPLNTYSYRYLRNDETYRSNCFIKILLQLPKSDFNKKAFLRHSDGFYQKLLEMPIEKAKQGNEVEIIPYETLYEFVLASLE
jgi:hypothetical protein